MNKYTFCVEIIFIITLKNKPLIRKAEELANCLNLIHKNYLYSNSLILLLSKYSC